MAGVVPAKRSTSGRKQWTLHDGPKSSLKRLRSQLASDGCPESQVVLAKQLLDEHCDPEVDKRENARLGVYWLIKASEQGNIEATELLKKCLKSGKGITEHNYLDVKSCITMTQDEKLARKAAKEMFASLSNGEDFITSEQLQKHMLEIDKEDKPSRKHGGGDGYYENSNGELVNNYKESSSNSSSESDEELDWTRRCDTDNEKITEDHLISAAINYSHGQLPLVSRILCLSQPNLKMLGHIPFTQRSVLHPFLALKILYYKLIRFLGRTVCFPKFTDLQLIFLTFVYFLSKSDNILLFLPMLIYYITFGVMVISTFQMLQSKREYQDFRIWSGLFISYSGGSLNAEEAEFQYIQNNLRPYCYFFAALLLNLLMYPLIAEQWIPQSELTIVAFCFTFMTLLGFMPKKQNKMLLDGLVLLSFAVNVIAKYPYETDPVVTQGWRFLDLKVPTFVSYVIGNGIEICINFRLLFYISIPIIFTRIASRENWRGTYKILIPHSVTLSWLQIVIISSQGATVYGLLRGTLALVGIVIFLPLVGITSMILPAAALAKWITTNLTYSIFIFSLFLACGLCICWLISKSRFKQYTSVVQIIVGALTLCLLFNVGMNDIAEGNYVDSASQKTISWETFQKVCHQPAWEDDNMAVVQQKCANLENAKVSWEGYVNEIKIVSITNNLKYLLNKLPLSLREYLYCYYGDKIQEDCESIADLLRNECRLLYNAMKSQQKCSLESYDKYTFMIEIRMKSAMWGRTPEVSVFATHAFKNFTLFLKPEDHIWFKGVLYNDQNSFGNGILGGSKPHINLEEIGCYACHNSKLTQTKVVISSKIVMSDVVNYFYLGFKFVLNVIFGPVVIFK